MNGMNGASKTELAILRIQEADTRARDRCVDMQLAVYLPQARRPRFRVGGRWDSVARVYTGAAAAESRIDLTPAQEPSWPAIERWLANYIRARQALQDGRATTIDEALRIAWDDQPPVFTLQLYGGRQGGKTHMACALVALVSVAIPGARCQVVSPIDEKTEEMAEILERYCLPSSWRSTQGGDVRLVNGSVIMLRTGRVTDLKASGPLEIGVINEAQEQPKRNWTDIQGNTLARGGLVVLAQNPPRRNIGEWTQDLYEEVREGRQPGTVSLFTNPALNPHASNLAMSHLASTMGEKERRRDVLGDMGVPVGDVALWAWSDSLHAINWIPTTWVDVTEEISAAMFGRPWAKVGGIDWDKGAGPSFSLSRYFRPHNAPPWAFIMVVEHGQRFAHLPEVRFSAHLAELEDKYGRRLAHKSSTIWVGDASGRTQSTYRRHDETDPPSWSRMQEDGWTITFPDPAARRNPRRVDRFELINRFALGALPGLGLPRVVMLAESARHVIQASRKLPRRRMEADRFNEHAHLVDAWTYPAFRTFALEYRALENGVPEVVHRHMPRGTLG